MAWIGSKRVAFVPVARPRIDAIPPDWAAQIERRIYFDPDSTGVDVSLRTYIHTTSHGKADLEGVVFPVVLLDQMNVPVGALHDRTAELRNQGFDAGALVMLGGPGAGSAEPAGFWARFVMLEKVGVWAMEISHVLAGYWDLYISLAPADWWIDNMACACATHPTAFTKRALGWIDPAVVAQHIGRTVSYDLHSVGLVQPPPGGRTTAVQVGTESNFLMIESRQKVDRFDAGLLSEGVIVYEIENPDADPSPAVIKPLMHLRTQTALTPGKSFMAAGGQRVEVLSALVGGFSIRVDDPTQVLFDRSGQYGTPAAAGPPTACAIPGIGVHNIAYRDTSGRLHELWRDVRGHTGTSNLTALANAPTAAGNPFAYVDPTTSSEILLYRGGDNNVHSLYWSLGPVGHDNLTGSVGAPKTAGDPCGWFTADSFHHVAYRTSNGHLHELWWTGLGPVGHGDLTAQASAPAAAGDPSAYVDTLRGVNIVAYRGSDKHIRSLYWSGGPVGHDDLSGFAGTPAAAGDPVGYYTQYNDTHQIVYRTADGHLWELFWLGVAPVSGWDLSAASGAPLATGNPAAYYHAATNTKHVNYRSADGTLQEIVWTPGGNPAHVDISAFASTPLAADRPAAFTVDGPNTQHVAFRGVDNHIYEVIR